jgi:predicted lipase
MCSKLHGIHSRKVCVLGGALPQNRIVWNSSEELHSPIWTFSISKYWSLWKQFYQIGNVNIAKHVCWLTVVIEIHVAEVREGLSASLHKSLQKLAQQAGMSYSCHKAVKTLQLFPCKLHVITGLWKSRSLLWVVFCNGGAWPLHV